MRFTLRDSSTTTATTDATPGTSSTVVSSTTDPTAPSPITAVIIDNTPGDTANAIISGAGAALSAYHGYKRNDNSIGWAIAWGVFGAMFPVFSVAGATFEGFAKPKKNS